MRAAALLVVAAASLLLQLASAQTNSPPTWNGTLTPTNPTPTAVYLQPSFNLISKIDGVEQTFFSDLYLNAFWVDDRVSTNRASPTYFGGSNIFLPVLEFINGRSIATSLTGGLDRTYAPCPSFLTDQYPEIAGKMCVASYNRYLGPFVTPLQLQEFPYDKQAAQFKIESSVWDSTGVKFYPAVDPETLASQMLPPGFEIIEWDIQSKDCTEADYTYSGLGGQTFSRFEIHVFVKRQPEFYLNKIVTVAILVVIMTLAMFVLTPDLPPRIQGCVTTFLALISVQFVAAAAVPKLAYSTRIDKFMLLSFFIIFISMIINCMTYLYRTQQYSAFFFLGERTPAPKDEKKSAPVVPAAAPVKEAPKEAAPAPASAPIVVAPAGESNSSSSVTFHMEPKKDVALDVVPVAAPAVPKPEEKKPEPAPEKKKGHAWNQWWLDMAFTRRRDFFFTIILGATYLVACAIILAPPK